MNTLCLATAVPCPSIVQGHERPLIARAETAMIVRVPVDSNCENRAELVQERARMMRDPVESTGVHPYKDRRCNSLL